MVKPIKIFFFRTRSLMICKHDMEHLGLSNIFPEAILICSNDGPRLTLTHYMAIFQGSQVSNSIRTNSGV